jgi:hypothetical protein
MAPATKRRKTQPQRYECHTCLVSRISSQFPNSNPTSACEHLINTCKRCLKAWVESQIETSVFTPQIACPECEQKMGRDDVEGAVTQKLFARFVYSWFLWFYYPAPLFDCVWFADVIFLSFFSCRYLKLERVYVAENTPGWRWCLAAGCGAGQIHVRGDVESEDGEDEDPDQLEQASSYDDDKHIGGSWSQDGAEWPTGSIPPETIERVQREQLEQLEQQLQREEQQEQERQQRLQSKPDICKCNKCGAKACVPCDRPWHANESCDEYKLRIKDKTEEEDATLAAIQKATKPCPNCSKNILKTGGCKHMYCKSLREPAVPKKRDVRANADLCRYPVPDRVLLGLFAPDQPRRSVLQVQ